MYTNVIDYLDENVEKFPEKNIYIDENDSVSFGELFEYSKSIGTVLSNYGYTKPVVVFMDCRKIKCLVSFMGIIRSGNYYCPIDVEMPMDRVKKILETLAPCAIITLKENLNDICWYKNCNIIIYEEILSGQKDEQKLDIIKKNHIDTNPLYVLFTSGSTGIPKGVVLSHRAVIDYTEWQSEEFGVTDEDIIANQAKFNFDLSVGSVYAALKKGCTMYVVPKMYFSFPAKLIDYLNEKKVTFIYWVPSALCIIANMRILQKKKMETVNKILFCGEVMPNKQLNVWRKYHPNAVYANLYGPTETAIASTYYVVDRKFDDDESLPIGIPCKNTKVILIDENNKEVQPGEIGELCILGSGLALGYFNDKKRTDEVFVQNPTNKLYREIMYKTGDLAKYNEYGEIIYICRKDSQIKHMGHRIELAEIENAASDIKEILKVICFYDESKQKIVLAYEGRKIDDSIIKEHLERKIMDYMIPGKYINLEVFPLNQNGKIDRKRIKEEYLNGKIK